MKHQGLPLIIFAGMSHDEVVAQGLLFFLAGYETTASAISFLAYSLATNPDCQDKLRQEIAQVMAEKVSVMMGVIECMLSNKCDK